MDGISGFVSRARLGYSRRDEQAFIGQLSIHRPHAMHKFSSKAICLVTGSARCSALGLQCERQLPQCVHRLSSLMTPLSTVSMETPKLATYVNASAILVSFPF